MARKRRTGSGSSALFASIHTATCRRCSARLAWPENHPAARFEVYLAPTTECWGSPVAEGTVKGDSQQLSFEGRVANYLRIMIEADQGGMSVELREVEIEVTIGLWGEAAKYAVAGSPYTAKLIPDLAEAHGAEAQIRITPATDAAVYSDGTIVYSPPAAAPGGPVRLEVEVTSASDPSRTATRVLEFSRLARREIAAKSVGPEGGTIEVSQSGTDLDGLRVVIPPGSETQFVQVWTLVGNVDLSLADTTPAATPFLVTGASDGAVLEGNPALLARLQNGNTAAPIATVAYGAEADASGHAPSVTVVGVNACFNLTTTGTKPEVFGRYVPTAIFQQFRAGQGACYRLEQGQFELYYWLSANEKLHAPSVTQSLQYVAAAAERTRGFVTSQGCDFWDLKVQIMLLPDIAGVGGTHVVGESFILLDRNRFDKIASKDDSAQRDARDTVYHEMTHVYQERVAGEGTTSADRSDGYWGTEGLAVFHADEVENTDAYLGKFGWVSAGPRVAQLGLRNRSDRSHAYRQAAFFKALKAMKGFNTCDYLKKRARARSAYAALDEMFGGTEARHDLYAEFVSTWLVQALWGKPERIDDASSLPSGFVKPGGITTKYLLNAGAANYDFGMSAGGNAAKFINSYVWDGIPFVIELLEPTANARGIVFTTGGTKIMSLKPNAPQTLPTNLDSFYVVAALDQGLERDGFGEPRKMVIRIDRCQRVFDSIACCRRLSEMVKCYPDAPNEACQREVSPPGCYQADAYGCPIASPLMTAEELASRQWCTGCADPHITCARCGSGAFVWDHIDAVHADLVQRRQQCLSRSRSQ
ncbi:MAG: hypothetical protein IPK13_10235 [Deltaproteobacteria bacterium]|nr:hypothetical protein [Deltaproteobacteria bacterium]